VDTVAHDGGEPRLALTRYGNISRNETAQRDAAAAAGMNFDTTGDTIVP
jgi:hypothetical protein